MKIAIVCDVLGEENNGATHAAMNFIRSLRERGHEVNIICPDQDKTGEKGYYVCPNLNLGPFTNYVKKVGVTIAKADEKIIESGIEGCDVVHIHLPFFMGNKAIKIAKKLDIPLTASFHMQAENFTSYLKLQKLQPVNKAVYKFIYKHTYSKVDAIHYPTEFIKNIFENNIKHKTNAYIISNGVNDECRRLQIEKPDDLKDKFVILTTGRYCTEKAQDVLLKAVGKSKYKNKIVLLLAGQGPKKPYFEKLAKKHAVDARFKFFSRKEIVDAINYSDLYVHPARVELEGIACVEAICCGKATIVSDSKKSATSTFAVDPKCIFKNNDSNDLAEKIDYFIEHTEERKEIGEKYFKTAVNFNQKTCMDKMEQMLYDVIKSHKKGNK